MNNTKINLSNNKFLQCSSDTLSLSGTTIFYKGIRQDSNVIIGDEYAGVNIISGINNVLLGSYAGYSITLGNCNVMLGYGAGSSVNVGCDNILFGQSAGGYLTSGSGNIIIGCYAGLSLQSTSSNILIGEQAGYCLNNGCGQIFIGSTAGRFENGDCNLYIGRNSGRGTPAPPIAKQNYGNVAIGDSAMSLTTGGANNNTIIGYDSGLNISNGKYNSFIGSYAGTCTTSGIGNVMLGYKAGYYETNSNRLHIANTGTTATITSSLIYGEFDNKYLLFNGNVSISGTTTLSGITSGVTAYGIYYNTTTKELTYGVLSGSSSSYIFQNGLTESSSTVSLGGTLTSNTCIDGNKAFYFGSDGMSGTNLSSFTVNSNGNVVLNSGTGGNIVLTSPNGNITINTDNCFEIYSVAGSLIMSTGSTIFTSNDGKGINYSIDYSAGFTPRSLVDKGYVTGLTSSLSFSGLTDTPSAYTGQGGKVVSVNVGETGLEFTAVSGGSGHTILEDGVSMTARAGLNFIGFSLTDDAVNDETEVEHILGDETNVVLTSISEGDILAYDAINSEFINQEQEEDDRLLYLTQSNISADGQLSIYLPAGYLIEHIFVFESSSNAAGNVSLGTAASGTQIVNAYTVGSDEDSEMTLVAGYFSKTADTDIYVSSSSWGSGVIDLMIVAKRIW